MIQNVFLFIMYIKKVEKHYTTYIHLKESDILVISIIPN